MNQEDRIVFPLKMEANFSYAFRSHHTPWTNDCLYISALILPPKEILNGIIEIRPIPAVPSTDTPASSIKQGAFPFIRLGSN